MNDLHARQPHYHQGPKPSALALPLFTIICILLILGIYAIAHVWDEKSRLEDQIIDAQVRHAKERMLDDQEWSVRVARAYQQGQRDALSSLPPADGMAVAQVCQAWRYHDQDGTTPQSAVAGSLNKRKGA